MGIEATGTTLSFLGSSSRSQQYILQNRTGNLGNLSLSNMDEQSHNLLDILTDRSLDLTMDLGLGIQLKGSVEKL